LNLPQELGSVSAAFFCFFGDFAMSADEIPKRLQQYVERLLAVKLDQEQQLHLAKIVVLWNSAEFHLKILIGELLERPGKAALITADLGNVAVWQLANNLANYSIKDVRAKEYVLLVLELYELVRSKRNHVVHGLPVTEEDGPAKLSRSVNAKSSKGTISTKDADISLTALKFLAETTAILTLAIQHSYGWLFAISLHQDGKLKNPNSGPPLIETGLLQNRISSLRPPPHNTHTKANTYVHHLRRDNDLAWLGFWV
jgi:hypothetical protein